MRERESEGGVRERESEGGREGEGCRRERGREGGREEVKEGDLSFFWDKGISYITNHLPRFSFTTHKTYTHLHNMPFTAFFVHKACPKFPTTAKLFKRVLCLFRCQVF